MLNIKYILKNVDNETADGPHDFLSIYLAIMEVNGDQQQFGSSKFFNISSKKKKKKKKLIQVWNDIRVSKLWLNFHFWVNNSFKITFYQKPL